MVKKTRKTQAKPHAHDELKRVINLISKDKYLPAAVVLQDQLRTQPRNPDFLYPLATCQRNLGEFEAALKTLRRLEVSRPQFAGTWLERARIFNALGRTLDALSAFEKCVRLNPAYLSGWAGILAFGETIRAPELRREAEEQYRHLMSLDRAMILILRSFYDGEIYRAERLCREYLRNQPKHVDAMRILARIGQQYGILDDAEFILESACEFEPQNIQARLEYIDVLHKRQQFGKALEQSKFLMDQQPDELLPQLACANQQMAIGEFESAISVYNRILDEHSDSPLATPQLYLSRGHAYKTHGDVDEAIQDYKAAYRKRTEFGDAYWSLANLKTYRYTQAELDQMLRIAESLTTMVEDRVHVHFALGKSYEDSNEFETSFHYYEHGNRLNRERLRYDAKEMTNRVQLQEQICTQEFLDARKALGCPAPDPIFIVGLPRAGSTLLEQILASHSQVEGTLELHHISAYAQKLDGRRRQNEPQRYPLVLRDLSPTFLKELGERYIQETRIHRENAPYFIDKMPNNFRHIGLISLILPNAKIIDARRHPMACCFSGYKQLFASGQEFTYGQEEIGTYYNNYCRLMDHWDAVLPGRVLRVHYEEVVADLKNQVRRILDYCGPPIRGIVFALLGYETLYSYTERGAGAPADLSGRARSMAQL